jgi:hypothetical protein
MITRIHKPTSKSNQQALAAFVQKKAEIDTMLARLQALSDEHFGYSPDEITWSHAESLAHYAELLKRITDQTFNEGEHAEYPTSPEERRMVTFDAIAPDGTRERLRFETQAEADAAADRYRETGYSLYWIAWSESLQRFVTIPEE